jgi:hypothetical protein
MLYRKLDNTPYLFTVELEQHTDEQENGSRWPSVIGDDNS